MRPTFDRPIPALGLWTAGHVIGTERLWIRTVTEASALPVHEAIMESLASLGRWLPWARAERSFDETLAWCRQAEGLFALRQDCHLHVWDKNDGSFVAGIGLHPRHPDLPCFEIGYWCRGKHTGKGFITEVVRALTSVAFNALGTRRLEIRCDPENVLSAAVARRARFSLEATLAASALTPAGKPRGEQIWVMFPDDAPVKRLPRVHFGPLPE